MTHSQVSTGDYLSRMASGNTTSQSIVVQNTAKTTMNWKGLSNTNTGLYGTGTAYMFITWSNPSNNIYV